MGSALAAVEGRSDGRARERDHVGTIERRRLLRYLAGGAGLVAATPLLAACGATATGAKLTTTGQPVLITYGNWEVYKTQADMHKQNVAAFNASQRTVRVQYEGIAEQKMAILLATGDAPNIVNWYTVDPFGPEGVLLPLDGYINADTELLKTIISRQALQQYVVKGKTYAFPSAIYCDEGVYCNLNMCAAAGVKVPSGVPFSLDQFQAALLKLLAYTKGKKNTWPIAPFFPNEYLGVVAGGPTTFNVTGSQYNIGNHILRTSYAWQYDYQYTRGISPPSAAVSSLGGTGGSVTMFQSGNIAMMMVDPYPLSPLEASPPAFKWSVVPGIQDKTYPVHVGIYPLSITGTCKDPQAAYAYLHYVATDKAANRLKLSTGYGIPDRADVARTATGPMGSFVYLLSHATMAYTAPPPLNSVTEFNTKVATPEWEALETGKTKLAAAIQYNLTQWKDNASYHTPS